MICPNCGKETEDGLFCSECGAKLNTPEAAAEPDTPEAAAEPVPEDKPADKGEEKWPKIVPILYAAGAALTVLVGVCSLISSIVNIVRRGGSTISFPLGFCLFAAATAVLFFLKTRKKPVITAIPYAVYALYSVIMFIIGLVGAIMLLVNNGSWMLRNLRNPMWIINTAVTFIALFAVLLAVLLAAAFILGMALKKKTKLFMILYAAVAAVFVLIGAFSLIWSIVSMATGQTDVSLPVLVIFASLLSLAANVCVHIGAVLALRNKMLAELACAEEAPAEAAEEAETFSEEAPAEAE